jgi:hypothetical protein
MRFRWPTLRLELVIIVLGAVLLALLGVAQNNTWMEENFQPGAATGMVVKRPLSVARPVERRATVLYAPTDETIPNPPHSQCATALAELERFHWSYLNREFHEEVLAGWQAEGCLTEIERRLGYRLVLKQGLFPSSTQPGAALSISIDLENEGFAAPVNPRPIELVLRHTVSGDVYTLGLNTDLRQWMPGVLLRIDESVTVPADLPLGDYDLALHIPGADTTLAGNPGYAVRFANADTWDSERGVNRLLHTLRVEEAVSGEPYLPSVEK